MSIKKYADKMFYIKVFVKLTYSNWVIAKYHELTGLKLQAVNATKTEQPQKTA